MSRRDRGRGTRPVGGGPYDRRMPDPAAASPDLVRRARAVLDRNRSGAYTCPSVKLYPHQWLWDSCFTAIGIARYDPPRAAGELRVAVPRAVGQRHAPAHDLRRRRPRRRQQPRLAVAAPSRRAPRRRHQLHHPAADRRDRGRTGRARAARRRPRARSSTSCCPKLRRLPPLAVPRTHARRLRAHHADPPVGVRPRLDPTVDARAARDGACRGGSASRSGCTWRASSARSATTRATSRPPSARPTTTVCACSPSRSTSSTTTSTCTRSRDDRSVLIEDVGFNAIFAAANQALDPTRRRRR